MQCYLCYRHSNTNFAFKCTLCSRDVLRQPRIHLAQILLEQESLGREIEHKINADAALSTDSSRGPNLRSRDPDSAWSVQRTASDQIVSEAQTEEIAAHVEALREEIKVMKIDIAKRNAKLLGRRSIFDSAKLEAAQYQQSAAEPVEKAIRRTTHRWEIVHDKIVESRRFLCKEAAQLYGLQQHKRRKGASGREAFSIAGLPVADLRDLNNLSFDHVTVSMTRLAQLVHTVSHYLSLKLPAEITTPHRGYPLPTIFSPRSSYSARDIHVPGTAQSHLSHNSPSTSSYGNPRSLPRPRPLSLEKPLSILAKDNPIVYASFVEGVSLLAWDIAWLCKSQGMEVGLDSWEEVCAMGRNLWHILLGPSLRSPVPNTSNSQPTQLSPTLWTPISKPLSPIKDNVEVSPPLGHFSHGTTYGFLASSAGAKYMRNWRLSSPVQVIEKVKAMLQAERTGAEWEILQGDEWEGHLEELKAQYGAGGGPPKLEERPPSVEESLLRITAREPRKDRMQRRDPEENKRSEGLR